MTLPSHLRDAAQSRTAEAESRATKALRKMLSQGKEISFSGVAREADVSTDFLYRHPTLRGQVERGRGRSAQSAPEDTSAANSETSAAVRALHRRITELRQQHNESMASLRKALEAAHGENLELRRKLAIYESD